MKTFRSNPIELLKSVWRHRSLIASLVQREVAGRYRGSFGGLLWSFLTPLLMLAVYTFVFSGVFRARWSGASESTGEFALVLFTGLMIFNLFAECFNRAPTLILANANFVKRIVFPLEILPIVALGAALFHTLVSLFVWFLGHLFLLGLPPLTAILLPVVLIPLCLFTLGCTWILASLGVYVRDVAQFTGVLTSVLLFLSPIFYPLAALPPSFRTLLELNPLGILIENARALLLWGALPPPVVLLGVTVSAVIVCCLGFAWFQKTRKGFADVI